MVMNNDKRGFWRKTGDWLNGHDWNEPTETRQGTVQPTAGEVSPLSGVDYTYSYDPDTITPEEALTIGTVFRAVDIISTSVSQLEVGVYRYGTEIPVNSKNNNAILRTLDPNQGPTAFYQETVVSLALWGNAYWRVYGTRKAGEVQGLEVLDPAKVSLHMNTKTGKKEWIAGTETLPFDKVIHLKHTRLPGRDYGTGPVQQGAEELRAALLLRQFQNEWFDTSVIPLGVLTTDQPMNEDDMANAAKAFSEFLKTHKGLAVLPEGLSYDVFSLKPSEAQFLEVASANDKNIARIFGVPVMLLSVEIGGTSFTYMNMEQLINNFIQNTLTRYINEIENALSDLLPLGQRVQFKTEGLLRSDQVTKWNIIKTQVEVGYTDGAELREAEGKAPLPSNAMPKNNPVTENKEDEENE